MTVLKPKSDSRDWHPVSRSYLTLLRPLGTAENALHRVPIHGGRCVGILDPPEFLGTWTGMPTRIACHLALRRRWPQAL